MAHPWRIRTYQELEQFAAKFVDDPTLYSLVVFGPPGIGKTEIFSHYLNQGFMVPLKGRLSGRKLFEEIRDNPGALFLFDDVRSLLRNNECVNLLMALAENKPVKTVSWNVAAQGKSGAEGETSIETNSRMVLLLNDVPTDDESLSPIFSRSVLTEFRPSKSEVHAYIGTWFVTDESREDVYNYIGEHLNLVPRVDARDYLKAAGLYDMDWQGYLHQEWSGDEFQAAAVKVLDDPTIPAGEAQVQKFLELCGGSRATFFRLKAKLLLMGQGEASPAESSHGAALVSKSHDPEKLKQNWMNN